MKIVNTEDYRYAGYNPPYHVLERKDKSEILCIREAKIVDKSTGVVIICRADGKVEPTYSTVNKVKKNVIEQVLSCCGAANKVDYSVLNALYWV